MMRFYLGTHIVNWLQKTTIPLFISHRQIKNVKKLKPSITDWCLDSGGFSELSLFGEWRTTVKEYASNIVRFQENVGRLIWCSQQDYMCEPVMLAKTRMSVIDHQRLTVENYLELKNLNSDLPVIPVLQGWENDDYLRHIEMFQIRGVDLFAESVVGIGSVCRRQSLKTTQILIRQLYGLGLNIHGFGVKLSGLRECNECFVSTDSMAWSYNARYSKPLSQCSHKNCANCLEYASLWYAKVISVIKQEKQIDLFY